jgi:hypothetical protein
MRVVATRAIQTLTRRTSGADVLGVEKRRKSGNASGSERNDVEARAQRRGARLMGRERMKDVQVRSKAKKGGKRRKQSWMHVWSGKKKRGWRSRQRRERSAGQRSRIGRGRTVGSCIKVSLFAFTFVRLYHKNARASCTHHARCGIY